MPAGSSNDESRLTLFPSSAVYADTSSCTRAFGTGSPDPHAWLDTFRAQLSRVPKLEWRGDEGTTGDEGEAAEPRRIKLDGALIVRGSTQPEAARTPEPRGAAEARP